METSVLMNMAKRTILPATQRALGSKAAAINAIKAAGADCSAFDDIQAHAKQISACTAAIAKVEAALHKCHSLEEGSLAQVRYAGGPLKMETDGLRAHLDTVEEMTESSLWPIPSYHDLFMAHMDKTH